MKNFKINVALAALLLGSTMAFAFKAPAAPKPSGVEWVRTGSDANPDGNSWLQQTTGTCETADRICKATFPSGYNPNMNTYTSNVSHATVLDDDGYIPAP